jgi:DNA uptake protein ComE-like DNA-binding protein
MVRSVALGCMILPILLWASLRLVPRPAAHGPDRTCARAQLIEGRLVCDEELVGDLAQTCSAAAGPLTAGDALAPGVCTCLAAAARFGPRVTTVWGCTEPAITRMPADQLQALAQIVDVNTAALDELASLPGIGPTLAARIIAGRPYATVDALLDVPGIGPKRLAAMRPRVRVQP